MRTVAGTEPDISGLDAYAVAGVDVGVVVFSVDMRAEYEVFDIDITDDLDLFSINAVWRF